ncbi:DEAD/DEAH box helicase [Accumulibacter sp.]|uniref:DEAD/DEAH box helicase n=1 Tax=Accumulibacter sp. TaxID=2053492 RepID=UPI0025EA48F5|nr:DEAD/DEAH box helicase [Accumulibacter sp.]
MTQSFSLLGLSAELTRVVAEQGYSEPTPVQAKAIPLILEGRDVLAGAQTGTGKTAGFTLPLLQRLATTPGRADRAATQPRQRVRALILTPTRELAAQVEESVRTYGKYMSLKSTLIYGGVNINPQIDALRRGVDILVATPGRLLDHLQQKTVELSNVEILVLDEADRMLDMGFIRDIRRILALLPAKRQNLLFSATFSDEIRKLADGLLHQPAMIEVARRNADSELVAQRVHPVDSWCKRDLLVHLVGSGDWRQVLVFTRMKSGANRLSEYLCKAGIEATAIHGNKSQPARTRALAGFKDGTVRVLVATDIAARGLDIEELPHVVNFELPNVPEDYVHRIGRTGRAGSTGEALSLVSSEERPLLAAIEKLLTRRIDSQVVKGFEPGRTPPPAAAATPGAPRGAHDANRRGAAPGRDGRAPRNQGKAAAPSRPSAASPAAARTNPPLQQQPPRGPQRPRADGGVTTAALFRSPARRGG